MNIRDLSRVVIYTDFYTRSWMTLKERIQVVAAAINLNGGFMNPSQLKITPEQLWDKCGVKPPHVQAGNRA